MKEMIKQIVTLITGLFVMVAIVSCSKDEGPIGKQGAQGVQGIPGKDGNVIISGTGAPDLEIGNIGDMYLDTTTSNLYGPKTENNWGTPLNLKGADGTDGQNGADGSDILKGSTAPSTTLGNLGDYYIDSSTGDLYGPKTNNGWGNPINLKGTANVVATKWINYNWEAYSTTTKKTMKYIVPDPVLAAAGYNSLHSFSEKGGVLLVYGKNYGASYFQLFNYEFRNGSYKAVPATTGNVLWVSLKSIDGSDLSDIEYDSIRGNKFRYVLIPAGTQLNGKGTYEENLSQLSWKEVKEKFNLKD